MPLLRTTRKDEIPEGTIREFQIDGHNIAIANYGGKFFAINNICLHRGGPLGQGEMEGNCVICPWHGWRYNVTTGKLDANPSIGVDCYPIELRGEDIFVQFD